MTLVFYDRGVDKSNWGMHEFVVPVHEFENLSSPPTHFKDLALYRLYILRSSDMESENDGAGSSSQMLANDYDDDHFSPSTAVAPCPPVQPWGIFDAGLSTSQMPPQQQHRPSIEHAAHYYHHQFAFGAASAGAAAQQQARDMPVHGAGLHGDSCQFASPPAPVPCRQPPRTRRHTELPRR
ncbi:hypothetical protein C2845_PM07G39180 [Panicum miliaceum]|uniref:NAC domain-containing protein n=1 Tax=Panicum miliaceum TaxID=4540 RepID=A0A3L6SPN4_PANMI|nr:hypothetical protein C2845_PM07G39180 [Panicum miliaceum]